MYNFQDVAVAVPQTSSDVEDIEQESIIPFLAASSIDSDVSLENSGLGPADCTPETDGAISEEILQRSAALWIVKTRNTHRIPQSVMDGMIADLSGLFQCALGSISSIVLCTLKDGGVTNDLTRSAVNHLDVGIHFLDIFKGLKTHHQQLKYFKEKFDLVVSSTTFFLGEGGNFNPTIETASYKLSCLFFGEG